MNRGLIPEENEIIFYTIPEGGIRVEVLFQGETFWLTQKQMANLFEVDIRTVSEHLQNIFASKELQQNSVIRDFRTTAADGKNYLTGFYSLDAIIAVGYRVNSPKGKILKSDVSVAKNYLFEKEIKDLERIVSMYLDYAELQASRHIPMKMAEWVTKLDAFLQFNGYQILDNPGLVSHEVAVALADGEYEKYRIIQDEKYISDFEREAKKITELHQPWEEKA